MWLASRARARPCFSASVRNQRRTQMGEDLASPGLCWAGRHPPLSNWETAAASELIILSKISRFCSLVSSSEAASLARSSSYDSCISRFAPGGR